MCGAKRTTATFPRLAQRGNAASVRCAGEEIESGKNGAATRNHLDWDDRPYYGHITYNTVMSMLKEKERGEPLMRSFPTAYPNNWEPHMIVLLRCKDVRISGITFLRSPSWDIYPYACERMVIDGIYMYTSLHDGVWADGIDPDGCKDLHISNSTIETGDDAIVFYSTNSWGPALPCENITVTNCRLTSASSAKFAMRNSEQRPQCDRDNYNDGANRGIAFM